MSLNQSYLYSILPSLAVTALRPNLHCLRFYYPQLTVQAVLWSGASIAAQELFHNQVLGRQANVHDLR